MSWFKKLLGKDEEEQAAPAASALPEIPAPKKPLPPSPAFAEDAVSPSGTGGKKVKLNFKKIPKQIVDAIAAETTGQPRTIVMQGNSSGRKGGLSGAFNQAASMFGADSDDMDVLVLKDPPPPPASKMPMPKAPKP